MKKGILIGITLTIVLIGIGLLLLFKNIQKTFTSSKTPVKLQLHGSLMKGKAVVTCAGHSEVCVAENGKIVAKKLTGKVLEYIKYICDDPRNCPTPAPKKASAAIAAIRAYTNKPQLGLTPLGSNLATGLTYYCTFNKECWAIDNKTNKVLTVK